MRRFVVLIAIAIAVALGASMLVALASVKCLIDEIVAMS